VQKPANCVIIDNLGLCTACNGTQFQLQNGQCVLIQTCISGQYLSSTGVCVNLPSGCSSGSFNPSTGVCLTCNNGNPAINGLCCLPGQLAVGSQCIDPANYSNIINSGQNSLTPSCITWHPSLGTCLQCNGNFSVDPTNAGCQ